MYAIIGTWKMSFDGVSQAHQQLASGAAAGDAVQHAIMSVEDNPAYTSVGYGGLPDHDGHVMTDAAYMDGHTLRFGAVLSAENIQNPIRAARLLCGRETNCVLAGRGAELFAMEAVRSSDAPGLSIRGLTLDNTDSSGLGKVVWTVCLVIIVPVAGYLVINSYLRQRRRVQRRRRRAGRRRSR